MGSQEVASAGTPGSDFTPESCGESAFDTIPGASKTPASGDLLGTHIEPTFASDPGTKAKRADT
jgi:hypothetical protein